MIPALTDPNGRCERLRRRVAHHGAVAERPAKPATTAPDVAAGPAASGRPWYGGSDRPEIVVPACPNCAHWDAEPGTEPALRCARCGWYWYPNPRPTAAVVIEREGEDGRLEFLVLRRAVEPALGWWDLPAGFLEPRETPDEGARREAQEEAGFAIRLTGLLGAYASRESNTVVFAYTARAVDPAATPEPDHESSEARWISARDVDDILPVIAFAPIREAIEEWRAIRSGLAEGGTDGFAAG
jgi:ADP-ribose pyrophosphatase YjhB (NUDIX family)